MTTKSADYCMLGVVKVTSLLAKAGSELTCRFSFGVRAWTEMEIRCVKGMHRLKLVSSENNSVFKGLIHQVNHPPTCTSIHHSQGALKVLLVY